MPKPIAKSALALLLSTTLLAPAAAVAPRATPAPLSALVSAVDIPYESFTLPNGLRVLVHTDRKAPIVAVSVWYHIGAKDEPQGKTGFAHLFEHLMFYGSRNAPGNLMERLEAIGATDWNGDTWFDRTRYFETVPTGALDHTLFLESDRMGHLLEAMSQKRLDAQRSVVQNEKRMGDNEPGGLSSYSQMKLLFPAGHPYGHETIGSMADLNAASLGDVKRWFAEHYGPNNAVLVLAGDIDLATAKAKVSRWFGAIRRGPQTVHPAIEVPSMPADRTLVMHDRVAATRVERTWIVPGTNAPDTQQLVIAASILGGLGSSRLDNALVRGDKTAVGVSAGVTVFEGVSYLEVSATVKPGVDAKTVEDRLDGIVAEFLKTGPTADEVQRAATTLVSGTVAGLEKVGGPDGKAVTLAEGLVYSGDPARYKKDLAEVAAATPETVLAAARRWMNRPKLRFRLEPGERDAADVAAAAGSDMPTAPAAKPAPAAASAEPLKPTITPPPLGVIADLPFPTIERATLSNGIKLLFARRSAIPAVRVAISFDAGSAADDKAKLGTQGLTVALLDEGTTTRSSVEIAEEEERLGASLSAGSSNDNTTIALYAPKPNLPAALDLLADVIRNPAFRPEEVERLRGQVLTAIASEKTDPNALALRILPPLIYGPAHPYGVPFSGSGDEAGVRAATRADLIAFQGRWLRPDNATLFVVGDTSLAEIVPMLEARLGDWRPPAEAKGEKLFREDRMRRPSRIVLIDRPQSPQSLVIAGEVLPAKGMDNDIALAAANEVLGASGSSRLSLDLREEKGWAYYAGSSTPGVRERLPLILFLPVQTDQTGPSVAAALADVRGYLGAKGTTKAELDKTVNGLLLSLPGSFETSADVLGGLQRIVSFRRPDDYYTRLPGRYRALGVGDLDRAARAAIDPDSFTWVVVGDAKLVRPQLDKLGLPIETMAADAAAGAGE